MDDVSTINGSGRPMVPPRKSVAATKLRSWRRDRGMSQEALAGKLGCRQKAISQYETGRSVPPVERALKLAKLSNASVPVQDWAIPEAAAAA